MAITYVARFDAAGTSGVPVTSFTVDTPAGIQHGDLLVMSLGGTTATNVTTPAGWTSLQNGTTTACSLSVFYKFWHTGDATSYNVTVPSARWAGSMQAWRGVAQPVTDVSSPTATVGTTAITCPAITPATAGAFILAHSISVSTAVACDWSSSNLDTLTIDSSGSVIATANAHCGGGHEAWTSGAFTPILTDSVTSTRTIGLSNALRPLLYAPPTQRVLTLPTHMQRSYR